MRDASPPCSRKVDVAGTGFIVLDRVYADGDLTDEALGGSCGNVLVSLAMLHRDVAPVITLGNDETGERLVAEFFRAGALVEYINRRGDLRSPVLAQALDTRSGRHDFSFMCPETNEAFPGYQPIGEDELALARAVLTCCSVFYADRLSGSILAAMRMASISGAVIFFEPSEVHDERLFEEALKIVSILKYSEDRLGDRLSGMETRCVRIVTYGAAGLEVSDGHGATWCAAAAAPTVLDTCGSGDMVSVGVIDWMLANQFASTDLRATSLLDGIISGQRLAAENCAYAGARGLFRHRGADYVRALLRGYAEGYSAATE